jgi:hypothetical protein
MPASTLAMPMGLMRPTFVLVLAASSLASPWPRERRERAVGAASILMLSRLGRIFLSFIVVNVPRPAVNGLREFPSGMSLG